MITVAALGTSAITRRTIASARGVDGLRFTTVASRDAARAASLASELGLDASNLDAVLADPRIEAVYVATPNAVHAGQIRAALDAGKHVLVEKPAVETASDWDEACKRASVRGVVLLENMRIDRDPVLARIAELLPTLGPIRRVAVGLSQRSSRYDDVLAGRRVNIFDPALGGGAGRHRGLRRPPGDPVVRDADARLRLSGADRHRRGRSRGGARVLPGTGDRAVVVESQRGR